MRTQKFSKIAFLFVVALFVFLEACAPTYKDKFMEKGKAKGWTEEQNLAALAYADRLYFLKKKPGDKQDFTVNYGLLLVADVRKKLDDLKKSFSEILDYKEEDNAKFVEAFGLRKDLEHEEKVLEATLARVRAYELDDQFQRLMGTGSDYNGAMPRGSGYDIKKIFLSKNIISAFPFTSGQIEDARARGILKKIEHGIWVFDRVYDRKEPDPNALDDPNAFIWKDKKEELELTNYKILDIDKPDNNLGNYIEGFRILDGKKESLPALKIFFQQNSETGVLVLDTDQEGRDPGFGVPDFIERVLVLSISGIMRNDQLLSKLFQESKEHARVKPTSKPINVEIAKLGDSQTDVWQKSNDSTGWTVPFTYKNKLKDNYNVKIKLARPSHADMDSSQVVDFATSIEYIAREWTGQDRYTPSTGAVTEFYRTIAPFDQKNITKAEIRHMENTKKIVIDFEDGNEEIGIVTPSKNKFVDEAPYAIEYTEGQKRWHIEKDTGSAVFSKRKAIALPKNGTGVYQ